MLKPILFLLITTSTLLLFSSCQKSYRVLNHSEIKSAYRQGEVRYIPSLKEVVEKENRDLGAHAMFQLGNFFRDLGSRRDHLSQDESRLYSDLENYFISNAYTDIDFNLKNIVYRNLMYSSHPRIEEIYEQVLDIPLTPESPDRENAIAVLRFTGERGRWTSIDFEKNLSLCRQGIDSTDPLVFAAGLECLDGLSSFEPEKSERITKVITEYRDRFQGNDVYRYYLIISHRLLRSPNI